MTHEVLSKLRTGLGSRVRPAIELELGDHMRLLLFLIAAYDDYLVVWNKDR